MTPITQQRFSLLGAFSLGKAVLGTLYFIAGTGLPPRVQLHTASYSPLGESLPACHFLLLAPSISLDATSGWRSHSAVPQHSVPFQSEGRFPRGRPSYQLQGAPGSSPCSCSCSAAHPVGSLLMGKALACTKERYTQLLFGCIRVVALALVTYGMPSFRSAC